MTLLSSEFVSTFFIILFIFVQSHTSSKYNENMTCKSEYIQEMTRGHECMKAPSQFNVITKTILLNSTSSEDTRNEIRKYFLDTFDIHTSLYENIKKEHLWYRAEPLRHPILWYAAHTAAFYVNKLRVSSIIDKGLVKQYESKFAVGVDEMSWDDKLEDRNDWPLAENIFDYRNQTKLLVLKIIDNTPLQLPIKWESAFWVILMGIEHERIHIETSSVIIRQFPVKMLSPKGIWINECQQGIFNNSKLFKPNLGKLGHSPKNELILIKGKTVKYGRDVNDMNTQLPVYGWDNEFGEQTMNVPDFYVSKYLVSNEEYYQFILDNGYQTEKYWTYEGWKWVKSLNVKYPRFWIKNTTNDGFYLRNMLSIIPMAWNWPVITNNLESIAFTNWLSIKKNKNIRLLTEDEWHVLRQKGNKFIPYWEHNANINLKYFTSESPIDMFEFMNNTGIFDVIGNVWQHTLTPQHPFKGFQVHPFYDDFTVPCFGIHHSIIKGGSWISTGNEATYTSRYQFRRHFYQHAGIRYVYSNRDISYLDSIANENNSYDDQNKIDSLTHFHYSNNNIFNINNYPKEIAIKSIKYYEKYGNKNINNNTKILDLGCAVGRTSFELAKKFNNVIGIDITARLISIGYHMQELGQIEWDIVKEGDIKDHYVVTAKELGIDHVLDKVFFVQNDALNLDPIYTNFDMIIASNIIDRLNNPNYLLSEVLHTRLNKNGLLLICDPYTWLIKYTSKYNWLGGFYRNNDKTDTVFSINSIKNILNINFKLIDIFDIPMIIRETERKHQHILTQCMIWKRK